MSDSLQVQSFSVLAGKKVRDISELIDVFVAQEGQVEHIIGKTGMGKTYEGTRRAREYLLQGYVVYTTWKMILPEYYDERLSRAKLFWRLVFFWKRRFYRFDLKKNWHWIDIDRPDIVSYIASLTDCIVFLDEGQDTFDSHDRITKDARKTITRTRHLQKTLIIISQRAQAVDVNFRANVTFFYKCIKTRAWFWPFKNYFKVYRTEEMDSNNFPIWESNVGFKNEWHCELWRSHFASSEIYGMYNSWYLRGGIAKSQEVAFEAYDLTIKEKLKMLFSKKETVPKFGFLEPPKPPVTILAEIKEEVKELEKPLMLAVKSETPDEISYIAYSFDEVATAKGV